MRSFTDLYCGVARHPLRAVGEAFVAFSVIWTLTEALSYFLKDFDVKGVGWLMTFGIFSVLWAGNRAWRPSKVEFKVANCDTTIEVLFGDLLQQEGIRSIAVSEFFESTPSALASSLGGANR